MKYIDLLKQTKEQREEKEYELENDAALNQLLFDIHHAKKTSFDKQKELNAAIVAKPFNPGNILRIQREIALSNKTIEDLNKLKSELFTVPAEGHSPGTETGKKD